MADQTNWRAIFLATDFWNAYVAVQGGHLPQVPGSGLTVQRPSAEALLRLVSLHDAAVRLLHLEMPVDPEADRGLQQQLLHVLSACLENGQAHEKRQDSAITHGFMRRIDTPIEEKPALSIAEIANTLKVSPATIRDFCKNCIGISLGRYLRLLRRRNRMPEVVRPQQE